MTEAFLPSPPYPEGMRIGEGSGLPADLSAEDLS